MEEGWERPHDDVLARARVDDPSREQARVRPSAPLPPPSEWGEDDEGPGSPYGSVRPPDTTVTASPSAARSNARRGIGTTLLAAFVGAVLGTAGTLALARQAPSEQIRAPIVEPRGGEDGEGAPAADLGAVRAVAEAVMPSVVRIDNLQGQQRAGLGSGVILRSDGAIITNNHVVEGADRLEVQFANGESVEARIVGADPLTDIAVIEVERSGLPAINVRTSPPVQVGELAIAIGSPFGLDASVTAGVVSALNRSIDVPIEDGFISIPNVVQTDAAINPGNSGGALVDASGRLVGVNSAILSTGGGLGAPAGNIGVGFAIAASDAVAVAEKLIEQGYVRHARLGISGGTLTSSVRQAYDVDVEQGVLIDSIDPGGPADRAGIRPGDVIVAAEGEAVESMDELSAVIRRHEPGDELDLTIVRDGERRDVTATLGEWEVG